MLTMPTQRPGPVLAIRADAGNRSGTGHVMRTLAVAQEWIRRGGNVHYLCSSMPDPLIRRLSDEGCGIEWMRDPDSTSTVDAVVRLGAAVLLVDHYELDRAWWTGLPRERRWRTAAVNDFTTPIHVDADLLISPRAKPLSGHVASGPEFFPIRTELRRGQIPAVPPPQAERILIVLGGADPLNVVPRVAGKLMAALPGASIRAVVGPAARNLAEVEAVADCHPALEVVHCPEGMLPHYEWADSAVVSPSTTAFEALHHGLVAGLVITAANQEEVAAELLSLGCAKVLADARDPGWSLDPEVLRSIAEDPEIRSTLASRGGALVDGEGAGRFCDLMGLPLITLRPAVPSDSRRVWEWANDPISRQASFQSDPIPWENHDPWFRSKLQLDLPFWLAVDTRGEPLAVVRFDVGDGGSPVISLNLAPAARGRRLSALIVRLACDRLFAERDVAAVDAWIRRENSASQRCFQRAGFVIVRDLTDRFLYRLHHESSTGD